MSRAVPTPPRWAILVAMVAACQSPAPNHSRSPGEETGDADPSPTDTDPPNGAPVAVDMLVSLNDSFSDPVFLDPLCNCSDPEGDRLTIVIVKQPVAGSLTIVPVASTYETGFCLGRPSHRLIYDPDPYGTDVSDPSDDSFEYRADDGQAKSNSATVTIDYYSPA